MKTLKAYGDELQADAVVKTDDSIVGYVEGREVFRYSGIRDFSHFALVGEWDAAPLSDQEKIIQLEETNATLKENITLLEGVVMEMAMNTLP